MFAPDQERAAQELVRVVRRGGKIALANWTPEGFVGRLFSAVSKHVPAPPRLASPVYWGNEARLRELFPDVARFRTRRRDFVFRYESVTHFLDVFRSFYGPLHQAYGALEETGQQQLTTELCALIAQFRNRESSRSLAIPAEYLEVVLDR